jgi:hypothetical protein
MRAFIYKDWAQKATSFSDFSSLSQGLPEGGDGKTQGATVDKNSLPERCCAELRFGRQADHS